MRAREGIWFRGQAGTWARGQGENKLGLGLGLGPGLEEAGAWSRLPKAEWLTPE